MNNPQQIHPQQFASRMHELSTWFGQKLSKEHLDLLHEALSKELSTEEFHVACDRVFAEWEQRRLPPPIVFVRMVKGDTSPGMVVWVNLLRAITADLPISLDSKAMFALESVGGLKAIRDGQERDRPFLRKEFLEYYNAAGYLYVGKLPEPRTLNARAISPAPPSDDDIPAEERQANLRRLNEWMRLAQEWRAIAKDKGMTEPDLAEVANQTLGRPDPTPTTLEEVRAMHQAVLVWQPRQPLITPPPADAPSPQVAARKIVDLSMAYQISDTVMGQIVRGATGSIPPKGWGYFAIADAPQVLERLEHWIRGMENDTPEPEVPDADVDAIAAILPTDWAIWNQDDHAQELELAIADLEMLMGDRNIPEYEVDRLAEETLGHGTGWRKVGSVMQVEQLEAAVRQWQPQEVACGST